jgi:hypothetical protein
METRPLEAIAGCLRRRPSRRDILRGLTGAGLVLTAAHQAGDAAARKSHQQHKHKHKGKRQPSPPPASPPASPLPQFNAFGCLDVGQPCQGDNSLCCSGICDPGAATCVAHDSGTCFADSEICTAGAAITCNGADSGCACTVTTGNAAFCADFTRIDFLEPTDFCRFCNQDADCEEEFGPGTACVVLRGVCSPLCATTDRTACLPPCPV